MDSALDAPLRDLTDAVDDFEEAGARVAHTVLQRFVIAIDAEPMSGFLRAVLPIPDVDAHSAAIKKTVTSVIGSGALSWPSDRAERVALQCALVRELAKSEGQLRGFAHTYCNSGLGSFTEDNRELARKVLRPLLRDIERLAEQRIVPAILFDAIGTLPTSGDRVLDELLRESLVLFREPDPASHQRALERLWDCWERLKSLENGENKRLSAKALLDQASSEPTFRDALEREARELTVIGNSFQIRHFESGKVAVSEGRHLDYLFHRMFSLIHLLLFARGRPTTAG